MLILIDPSNEVKNHHSRFCKEDSKTQTCVLPLSCLQPLSDQSRTHFESSLQNLEWNENFTQNKLNKKSAFKAYKEDSKTQTCVLPLSCLQPLSDQSRTHFESSLQNLEWNENFTQNKLNKKSAFKAYKEDSKTQTCVLPLSCLQPLSDQSRTHFESSLQNLEWNENFTQNKLNKKSAFKAYKEDSKTQTCVLPLSCLQPLSDQSRTHFESSLQNLELRKNFIQNKLNKQDH